MNQDNATSPHGIGLRAAVGWQKGRSLPTPNEKWSDWQLRDWVRGWNAGVAGRGK
jgi:hypothetical protein